MASSYYPNRQSVRLKDYDYTAEGLYFITICSFNRKPLFGHIANGEMRLNSYGQIAYNSWLETERVRPYITLGEFVIMPNHMHAIFAIDILENIKENTAEYIHVEIPSTNDKHIKSHSVGSIIGGYKAMVTSNIRQTNYKGTVWQRNYFEHIIRSNQSLNHITQYILENPYRWKKDCYYEE